MVACFMKTCGGWEGEIKMLYNKNCISVVFTINIPLCRVTEVGFHLLNHTLSHKYPGKGGREDFQSCVLNLMHYCIYTHLWCSDSKKDREDIDALSTLLAAELGLSFPL